MSLLDGMEIDATEYEELLKYRDSLERVVKMVVRAGIEAKREFPPRIVLNADCALFEEARKALGDA